MNLKIKESSFIGHQIKSISILTCLGILAFWATLYSPFIYDDAHAIVQNHYIQKLSEFQKIVGIENIFNRSVLLLTFTMNREIGGLDVFGYHLMNVLIHILTGIVWYFSVREILFLESPQHRPYQLPIICASIHLLNPLAVETVTYISSRSSGLATLFYLLAFYLFCRLVNLGKKNTLGGKKILFIFGILGFLFLGVGTKEIVITFPLIATIYLWLITPVGEKKFLKTRIGVLVLPLLLYFIYRYVQQGNIFSLNADPISGETSRYLYFLSQIKFTIHYYLLKLFLPFNLNFEPNVKLITGFFDAQLAWALGILIVVTVLVFRQKSLVIQFAVLWFFITLLPSSSFIPLKQIVTEHRTYLPSLGFSLALGWLILKALPNRAYATYFLLIFLSLNFLLTTNRSLDYRSKISIWQDTAIKSPTKALVHNNLATAYMEVEMFLKAEEELALTLQLNPSQSDVYANLGHINYQRKKWSQAINEFDHAITLGSNKPDTYFFAGLSLNRQKAYLKAIPYFEKAVNLRPHLAHYHFKLGDTYRQVKAYDQALHEFRQTLKIQPRYPEAHNNIGVIFWNLKAYDKAEIEFKKALEIQPNLPEIHFNLAILNLKKIRNAKAIPYLEKTLELQPENKTAQTLLNHAKKRVSKGSS